MSVWGGRCVACRWGAWRLDSLTAVGAADSDEGLVLEELSCASGPAQASMRGALLGARQDASLLVTNFPLAMLQPLYAALPPALQVRAPPPRHDHCFAIGATHEMTPPLPPLAGVPVAPRLTLKRRAAMLWTACGCRAWLPRQRTRG